MHEQPAPSSDAETEKKLVPESKISSDDQMIIAGLIVFLLLIAGTLLAGRLGGGDDGGAPATIEVDSGGSSSADDLDLTGLSPEVSAAVAGFSGVAGSADGSTAVLTGFVDTDAQSAEAEAAAGAVEGIESVDNQLETVDAGVLSALDANGVAGSGVAVDGLVATVTGDLASEDLRQPALDAAAAVPGVASVVDELTVAAAPAEPAEPAEVDLSPEVSAAVAEFSGVNGSAEGDVAVLAGVVESDGISAAAEAAAAAVPGINSVDNQLTIDAPEPAEPADLSPEVSAAVAGFSGVAGSADGSTAVLTGFVDTDAQSAEAEAVAGAVEGIESVDNQLKAVDAGVIGALDANGVAGSGVAVDGLVATVTGELASEDLRQPALDAAAAVPGVASVVDQLTVAGPSLADSLNALVELEPVQFATSSSEVLPASFATLDQAAEIILASTDTGAIEVQGYTDIRGSEQANLDLSDARAAAVVQALVDRSVPAERLTSAGFGGTTQFGDGTTDEAYAANRRVVFVPGA